ncbi:MAG: hypothetical protein SWQ30_06895 [Thermodesulfobacteriota bacterium]|nr:hypothetical protein [Thermodesulfobacteriota bacterium]
MKKGLRSFLVVWLVAVTGLLVYPALSVGAGGASDVDSSSPLFLASLDKSLSDLSSSRIALDGEVYDPQGAYINDDGLNAGPDKVIELADAELHPGWEQFPTTAVTCANSGGATCRGTATCAGSETCFGNITCGATCAGSGGATCAGTVTCGEHTCSGRICREMSPYR